MNPWLGNTRDHNSRQSGHEDRGNGARPSAEIELNSSCLYYPSVPNIPSFFSHPRNFRPIRRLIIVKGRQGWVSGGHDADTRRAQLFKEELVGELARAGRRPMACSSTGISGRCS